MSRPAVFVLGVGLLAGCEPPPKSACDPPRGDSVDWFADATTASGLAFDYEAPDDFKGGGLAIAELTGDGRADVVAGRRGGGLALFENLGGLRFADITAASGLDGAALTSALAAADLDGDGDRELIVAGDGVTRVFDNLGAGQFAELPALVTRGATEHVLPVDLDGDARLDLYLANNDMVDAARSENRLYMNRGGLVFEEVATAGPGASWATSAIDFDHDGDQDLYVANDTLFEDFGSPPPGPTRLHVDLLLRNDGVDDTGAVRLTDVATELGLATRRSSMGGLVADFDGDELLDLYVLDFGPNKLFLGTADGGFVEAATAVGVDAGRRSNAGCGPDTPQSVCLLVSWGAAAGDFDLDGFDDLVVTNGAARAGDIPPVQLWSRTETGWIERDSRMPCADARAVVTSDLDDDGDLDLVLAPKEGPLVLYENRAARRGGWLRVALAGTVNRDGVGARVTVRLSDGPPIVRVIGSGGMPHSSAPYELHVGLGGRALVAVEVAWPSGTTTTLNAPETDTRLVVNEAAP